MIIIPAIDIYKNKVVRLSKGDFGEIKFYKKTPLLQAIEFETFGFNRIHIVDLLGSKSGKITEIKTLQDIESHTNLEIQLGGGIRNKSTADELFSAGVDQLIIGSLAIKDPKELKLILEKYTPEKIIIAADVEDDMVKVSGWTEKTPVSLNQLLESCLNMGITKFICTDISRDGMFSGLNIDLYKKLLSDYPAIKLIASGGVRDISDILQLRNINPYAVVVGKALYENKIDLKELSEIAL
jgi:phosphoribosylformimino-5-aminoimidazole carboxamide ribotide isomerase